MGNKQTNRKRLNRNQSNLEIKDSAKSLPKDIPKSSPRAQAPHPQPFQRNSTMPIQELNRKKPQEPDSHRIQRNSTMTYQEFNSKRAQEPSSQLIERNLTITIQELDGKITDTKEKIKDCDKEIQALESSPSASSKKLLFISKMKRENLNNFVDDLILKQYFLDKKLFESSLLDPGIVKQQEVVKTPVAKEKTPSFRDILRQQRKSGLIMSKVEEVSAELCRNPFYTGNLKPKAERVASKEARLKKARFRKSSLPSFPREQKGY